MWMLRWLCYGVLFLSLQSSPYTKGKKDWKKCRCKALWLAIKVLNLSPVGPTDSVVKDSHIVIEICFTSPSLYSQTQEIFWSKERNVSENSTHLPVHCKSLGQKNLLLMGTKGILNKMLYLSCKMNKTIFGFNCKWRAEKNATHTYSRKKIG